MADFKERFGLNYLDPRSQSSSPWGSDRTIPEGLGQAMIAYGGKILSVLNAAPGKTMRLFDIAKEISTRIDALSPVTRVLMNEGYIERVSEDSLGNDTFRLTVMGEKVAAS